jgi:hypothetical protein
MAHLYLIDFDRTIFDTSAFSHELLASLVTQFDIDPADFRRQMPRYVLPQEVGYDFFAHATAITGQDAATITRLLTPHLSRADYAYPDVAGWVERHHQDTIAIITVGTPAYQELKFQYTPVITPLRKYVVGENKGKLIHDVLTGAPSALDLNLSRYDHVTVIDDNPVTFTHLDPPSGITGIYLSRPGEKYAGQSVPPHIRTITSLGDLS